MIDLLTDLFMRPGYPPAEGDRSVVRASIQALWESGCWVLERSEAGSFLGWMAWLRTDRRGADLIRAFDMDRLVFLAIPIAGEGPIVVILFNVIAPGAPLPIIGRLYRGVEAANPDASHIASFYHTRRGCRWVERVNRCAHVRK
jgi:hypothetical protein